MFKNLARRLGLMPDPEKTEIRAQLRNTEAELAVLQRKLEKEAHKASSGQACIEAVLARGIEYYDSEKLNYADQVTYVQKARDVLANETLQNEIRHLEADWVTYCAKDAHCYEEVRDMRMSINALELLLDRLANIPDPRKPAGEDEPFASV